MVSKLTGFPVQELLKMDQQERHNLNQHILRRLQQQQQQQQQQQRQLMQQQPPQ